MTRLSKNSETWLYLLGGIAMFLIAGAIMFGQAAMEARTFRKLTGRADVTWWDAMWVNLRVDDD